MKVIIISIICLSILGTSCITSKGQCITKRNLKELSQNKPELNGQLGVYLNTDKYFFSDANCVGLLLARYSINSKNLTVVVPVLYYKGGIVLYDSKDQQININAIEKFKNINSKVLSFDSLTSIEKRFLQGIVAISSR